jgi:hypothetical protein
VIGPNDLAKELRARPNREQLLQPFLALAVAARARMGWRSSMACATSFAIWMFSAPRPNRG